jgi:polyisoprenoid-binding protein YceI
MKTLKTLFALLFISVSISFAQTNWEFDKSHSKVGFSVTHLLITDVEGQFKSFEGKIVSPGDDFKDATVEFSADIASIDTDNDKRDNHLKSDDFFNAEKFPKMIFKSKSFTTVDGKTYKLVGDLTIRDVTKEVELDVKYNGMVKDPWGNTKTGFSLEGVINRFDFNLKWNSAIESGGLVVGEDVTISAKLQLVKK